MRLLLIFVGWCFLTVPAWAGVLKAGAFAIDVTPEKLPVSVNGGMSDRMISVINDRPHARCLVVHDGTMSLAIVVVDSCMIPREVMDSAKTQAAKLTGLSPNHILISATHSHSAPTAANVFQSVADPAYQKFLAEKIAIGIRKAKERLEPAKWAYVAVDEPSQVFVRRWKIKPEILQVDPFGRMDDHVKMNPGFMNPNVVEPTSKPDSQLSIVSFQKANGKPLAVLMNYSLHYVGGNPGLSGDYFAATCEKLGEHLHAEPGFMALLSNGTSGDVNNVDFSKAPAKRQPGEQIGIVSSVIAKRAAEAIAMVPHVADISLAVTSQDVMLGVRKPDAADLARARKLIADAKDPKKLLGLPEIYAGETLAMATYPDAVPVQLMAMRLGDVGIVGIPCEVFTAIGLEIKAKSPMKRTFTISLANGYNGYLPTPAEHALGGYETWRAKSSYLEVEASPKIMKVVLELLERVKP